ncbi:Uncharacterised protein r2_g3761 [Pycnogonum litorale]
MIRKQLRCVQSSLICNELHWSRGDCTKVFLRTGHLVRDINQQHVLAWSEMYASDASKTVSFHFNEFL